MPIPSSPSTMQRPDLGIITEEYSNRVAMSEFIGLKIMPIFESATASGQWTVIPLSEQLRRIDTRRAIGAAYAQDDYTYDFDTFQVKEYGAESPVYVEEAKIYKRHIQSEVLAVERAVQNVWRDFEFGMAEICHDPINVGTTIPSAAPWTDNINANIKEDIKRAKIAMRQSNDTNGGFGIRPNMLVVTEDVLLEILDSQKLMDAVKDTSNVYEFGGMQAKLTALSQHLGVDTVEVAYPLINVAPRNQPQKLRNLWPNNTALLLKASNGGMNMREAAFGRTILWTDDSPTMMTVEQYYVDALRKDVYRARVQVDRKKTFTGAMCHITGIAG